MLFKDISGSIILPEKLIDRQNQAFNAPFVKYGSGSYFGDDDNLRDLGKESNMKVIESKKYYRSSTARCEIDAEILVIKHF